MTVSTPDTITPGGAFPVAMATDIARPGGGSVETSLTQAVVTSGERYASALPAGAALNGAVQILDATRKVGWTIPDGARGNSTYVTALIPLAASERDALVGRTIRLKLIAQVTEGYAAAKPFTTNTVLAVRSGGQQFDNVGTFVRNEQLGALLYREFDYVVTATDVQVGIVSQVSGSAGATGQHSFQFTSLAYEVRPGIGLETQSDFGLVTRLKGLGLYFLADSVAALSTTVAGVSGNVTALSGQVAEQRLLLDRVREETMLQSDPITDFQTEGQGVNGGVTRTSGNPPVLVGITIPAGSTGQASYSVWKLALGDFPAGTQLRLTTYLTTSNDLLSTFNFAPAVEVRGSQGTAQQVAGSTSAVQISTNVLQLQGNYIVQGSVRELMGLLIQFGSTKTGGSAADRFFEHSESYLEVVETAGRVSAEGVLLQRTRPLNPDALYSTYLAVALDGTGAFATIVSGFANTAGRSSVRVARVDVGPGDYAAFGAVVPRDTLVAAKGPLAQRPMLKGWNIPSASLGTISTTQPLWVNDSARLRGIRASVKNGRYTVHSDSGPSDKRATMVFDDCDFEHLGNQEAIDWQTANGGNPAGVWSAVSALGAGLHSGQTFISRRTRWAAPNKPFYFHDTIDWTDDAYVLIESGSVVSTNPGTNGYDFDFKCLGSMRRTIVDLKGVACAQPVNVDDKTGTATGWLNTRLDAQPANRMQITVNIWGPRSIDWTSTQTNCSCLELRGPTGSAATPFALSGAGAIALVGDVPDYRVSRGGTSRTAAYSQFAITSDVNANVSLPKRLGDLTASPKVLTIAGPVTGSITLDENYGAMASNAAVVTALNNKLTAAGLTTVVFYVSTPYEEMADVRHPDIEIVVKNTDVSTIARGNSVAVGAKRGECKLTVSTTTPNQLLGIAVEDIAPGAFGRVMRLNKGGLISQSHLVLAGVGTVAVGDVLYVSATAGALSTAAGSGAVPVLKCVETGRTSRPFTRWEFV